MERRTSRETSAGAARRWVARRRRGRRFAPAIAASWLALLASCATCGLDPEFDPRDADADISPPDGAATDAVDADAADAIDEGALLRVATYNVRMFWDTVCDSERCGPGDFERALTPDAFAARADEIARAALGLEVDILVLQEVESEACLDALLARVGARLPAGVIGESGWPASLDVAVLGPSPPIAVALHGDTPMTRPDGTPTSFARELLEVHFDVGGQRVIVFAAHFKSKANDDPGRRLAEAQTARVIVEGAAAAYPDALVILAGDLNDTPGSPPLEALEGDGGLFSLTADMPLELAWSISFGGVRSLIDHLHVAPGSADAYLPNSARTVRDPGRVGYGGSDHAAVRALLIPPITPARSP